ncbi:hypothetical protein CRI94_05095 [Longibacter salinarum]|uniref:Carboxymuconolactone decarboxylase-like domain-containing protein n=2 Tax=Longibacter salinarum TaxID=1850348 RepID=A0A2A8D182_9BACT|nr:hypothetical protein CRI94_05095 [Longibacter salinarum]
MSSTPSAPTADASSVRESARQALGMVPNLITEISNHNPTVARACLEAGQTLGNGLLTDAEENDFSELGIDRDVLYEIVGLIGLKTISNYINHIAGTEIDEAFR